MDSVSHAGWVTACCLSPPPPYQALCCCLTPYPVNPLNLPGGVGLWEERVPFSAFCMPLSRRNYENSTCAIYSPGKKQPLLYSQIHLLNLMILYVYSCTLFSDISFDNISFVQWLISQINILMSYVLHFSLPILYPIYTALSMPISLPT